MRMRTWNLESGPRLIEVGGLRMMVEREQLEKEQYDYSSVERNEFDSEWS